METLFRHDENTQFHAGELLYVTKGSYSDYSVCFIARALIDFDARAYVFMKSGPFGTGLFEDLDLGRLLAEDVIQEVEARELHISFDS